ncbi:MAG: EAL domain-containing protein [Marinicellaceae bacterium]
MSHLLSGDTPEDLCNLFFNDSNQAIIIVNADHKKIIHVNDALIDLLGASEDQLIGKNWYDLDKPSNQVNYDSYTKEISSNDSVNFSIEYQNKGIKKILNANYHMSVLEGEIVFLGYLISEKTQSLSPELFNSLDQIYKMDSISNDMESVIFEIKKTLSFDFVLFIEFNNNKIINSIASGNKEKTQTVLNNSKQLIIELLKNKEELRLDKNLNKMGDYVEILTVNSLQSFCHYPIHYQNKIYGSIIAGGENKIENWNTISILLNALVCQSRFALFQQSIVEQRELEGQFDKLTGLANRNAMSKKFAHIIKDGISADKYLSLMIIDIDKLNFLNKSLGIEYTNQLIICIAQILTKEIRSKGEVFRLSGDEFMILYHPHLDKKLAESMVKDLIKKLSKPILLSNGEDICVNFNIGISIFPDDGQTASSMMKNADLAMYDAKLKGKNSYVVFKYSETGQALKQKTEMVENLKNAIQKKHFTAYFQPKINAQTEDIIGFEALVRWIDPEIGLINPGHFIPLAEETGLINEIGDFITQQACEKLVEWQKRFGLSLSCSINLSAVQLCDPGLSKKLDKIINSSGVHPHFVDFEITETISLDEIPNLVNCLNEIVDIGCTLSIDDFGTGHSSLDYVKRIPAKYIKIDQSFVRNIGLNPEDEAILDATINIAKRLNRELVAEGVETEQQREYLLDRDCEYFQGFLFSRPLPPHEIDKLLEERVKLMGSR